MRALKVEDQGHRWVDVAANDAQHAACHIGQGPVARFSLDGNVTAWICALEATENFGIPNMAATRILLRNSSLSQDHVPVVNGPALFTSALGDDLGDDQVDALGCGQFAR